MDNNQVADMMPYAYQRKNTNIADTHRRNIVNHSFNSPFDSISQGSSYRESYRGNQHRNFNRRGASRGNRANFQKDYGRGGFGDFKQRKFHREQDKKIISASEYVIPAMTTNPWEELEQQYKKEVMKEQK